MPILLNVFGAVLSFGLAAFGFRDLAMAGYPDGHVTAYQKAASGELTVLASANLLAGLCFLLLAWYRGRPWQVALAVVTVLILAALTYGAVPWYFITHLRLENGGGG